MAEWLGHGHFTPFLFQGRDRGFVGARDGGEEKLIVLLVLQVGTKVGQLVAQAFDGRVAAEAQQRGALLGGLFLHEQRPVGLQFALLLHVHESGHAAEKKVAIFHRHARRLVIA